MALRSVQRIPDRYCHGTVRYSASPRILALAGMYWDMLNPGSEIQTMLDDMLNPSTARGYGLDVWGAHCRYQKSDGSGLR